MTVSFDVGNGLLHLPADSPVLIQSGFAILAIAKISAARNRHPEMIVSLSISPADEAVYDVGGNVVVVVQMRDTGWAVISLTSPPSTTGACCCGSAVHFAATLAPSRQPSESFQLQKTHKSITSQMLVVVQYDNTVAHSAPKP